MGHIKILTFVVCFFPQSVSKKGYTAYQGYSHFAAGLACGLSSLAAGYAIGIVGDAGVRANAL